jgi:GH24 family phage-related lysozyme (muramidase)
MATGSDVLKEFVVALGFKVDDRSLRNAGDAIGKLFRDMTAEAEEGSGMIEAAFGGITVAAGVLAAGVTAAVGAMVGGFVLLEKAVGRVATGLAHMYYQAQRAGSSVGSLRAVESAAQKIGFREGEGAATVEAFGTSVAVNPGLKGLLRSLGVNPEGDSADVLSSLLQRLQKMPTFLAEQYAGKFGVGQGQYLQYRANLPQYLAEIPKFKATEKASGFDAQKAAEDAVRYERALVDLNNQLSRLGGILAVLLMPHLTRFNAWLSKFLETVQSSGLVAHLVDRLNEAVTKLVTVLSAHGEGIFAGLIAGFGLLDSALTSIGKTVDWATAVFEAFGKSFRSIFQWIDDHTPSWAKAAAKEAADPYKMGEDARRAVGGVKGSDLLRLNQSMGEKLLGWLEGFIKHSEAGKTFTPLAYADQGHMSIGYGHQIQPDEQYLLHGPITKEKAEELYRQDVAKARSNVLAQTKGVKLNEEMIGSLTDLAYNLGGLSTEKTGTLLDALKSGNYEAAAKAFELYDHAGGKQLKGLTDRRLADEKQFRLGMEKMGVTAGKTVSFNQDTKITVNGAGEPQAVARHVANEQQRVHRDAVRNMMPRTV